MGNRGIMKTICAYCKALIKDDDKPDKQVSHGLCKPCAVVENKKLDAIIAAREKLERDIRKR